MQGSDKIKRQDFVDNFEIIDDGLSKFYVATLTSENVYKVTTGLNKTSLSNGYSIRVAIPSNSTGAVSITVDSVTVPVKKPNGTAVTMFYAGAVYTLNYNNSVFILASDGSAENVSFTSDKLLTGCSANNTNGEKIEGTMPNNGAVFPTLNCDSFYTIPKGYHNGAGVVTVNSLASQTPGTAGPNNLLSGQIAWSNGAKMVGTMPNRGAITAGNSIFVNNDVKSIYCRFPQGGYVTNATSGYPEISYSFDTVANVLGITANKILAGNTICGVNGTVTAESLGGLQLWSTDITTVPFVQDGFNGYYFAKHSVTLPFAPKQILLKVHSTSTTKYFSYLTSIYNLGTVTSALSLTNYNSSSGVNRISASMSGLVLDIEVGNTGGAVGTIALIELIVIG